MSKEELDKLGDLGYMDYTSDEWDELYGYNSVITDDDDDDDDSSYSFCEYDWEELSTNLYIIRRLEASDYLEDQAQKLPSWSGAQTLLEAFDWNETAQGYGFWEEIYNELISLGTEDPNHPALEEQT